MQEMQETWVSSLDLKDPLEKEMTIQYSCLKNPMDKERGGYRPQGHKELDTAEQLSLVTRGERSLWMEA